jgi:hypothetical protein
VDAANIIRQDLFLQFLFGPFPLFLLDLREAALVVAFGVVVVRGQQLLGLVDLDEVCLVAVDE